jgi:hypothetical protein
MGMPMGGASRPWVFPFPCARVPSGGRVPARVPACLCRVPLPAGGIAMCRPRSASEWLNRENQNPRDYTIRSW